MPVVNIAGIKPGRLRLTGPVLADIYAGKIKSWNDPAHRQAQSRTCRFPRRTSRSSIARTVRARRFNFTHYLSQVSPTWKSGPGEGKTVSWPAGVGGKGNEGVAGYVKQIPNSIGYVEYAYVVQNNMAYALLQNSAGTFVSPSAESFQAAAASADWKNAKDFYLVMTNAPGANAYPITATTFIADAQAAEGQGAVRRGASTFFKWALEQGPARRPEARLCAASGRAGAADRDLYRRQPSSEPSRPQAAPRSGAGADRLFQLVTAGAAWFVLLLLGGAAASMAWGGRLAFETFGWGFRDRPRLGCGWRQVRRARPDLRNAGHLVHRPAASRCRSASASRCS